MLRKVKDPVSGYLHLFGIGLSVAALAVLVAQAALHASPWHVVGFSIFGAGLILLYGASTVYHLARVSERATLVLRKIDHCMIFALIAATYTPICLIPLRGAWGWTLFGVVWGLAITGIVLKAVFFQAPRWLYTLCYVALGWSCLICIAPLLRALPAGGLLWLLGGGVAYSVGALCYGLKWPLRNARWFGFHEIFHILILAGSFCHFWLMFRYVLPL